MTDNIDAKCLDLFPTWLRTLDEDVQTLFAVLKNPAAGTEARKSLAGGVNYLFKSLDLIPDGIDDIGYLDDAFVMRLAAKAVIEGDLGNVGDAVGKLGRLANDADVVKEFLGGDLYDRLEKYVRDLRKGAARGRTVDEIVNDEAVLGQLGAEVDAFVKEYRSPGFTKDDKNLIKLRAFLEAKLPK
jgi:uncharacterized membrane protein YkvA (DUF1232 family)